MEFAVGSSDFTTDVIMASVEAERFRAKTLVDLSITFILKNSKLFIGRGKDHFKNLPNTIVQRFFDLMADQANLEEFHPAHINPGLDRLVLQLLNTNVEEFAFRRLLMDIPILTYALQNCPSFRKACISFDLCGGKSEELACKISTNWERLKMLVLEEEYTLKDKTFHLIRKYIPGLQNLEMIEKVENLQFKAYKNFTMKSVKNLAQMKHLKILALRLGKWFKFNDPIWAHIAGQIPCLQKLMIHQDYHHEFSPSFIKNYGKFYQSKPLVLEYYRLGGLDFDDVSWPQNVAVEVLEVHFPQSLSLLHTIPKCVKELIIRDTTPDEAVQIVEIFGHGISKLLVNLTMNIVILDEETFDYKVKRNCTQSLNLHSLLTACPQIEEVSISTDGAIDERNISNNVLAPEWFQNIRHFSCVKVVGRSVKWSDIYFLEKILLGSDQVCSSPSLEVDTVAKLRVILEVLRVTNNSCKYYSKLKHVQIDLKCDTNEQLQSFHDILELVYRLIATSPLHIQDITMKIGNVPIMQSQEVMLKCQQLNDFVDNLQIGFEMVVQF